MIQPSERDWHTSVEEEGGVYSCTCYRCGNPFYGYKRRVVCKLCHPKLKEEPVLNPAWVAAGPAADITFCIAAKPEITDSERLDWLFEHIHMEWHTTDDGQIVCLNTRGKIDEMIADSKRGRTS